jgi:hypothetical protein
LTANNPLHAPQQDYRRIIGTDITDTTEGVMRRTSEENFEKMFHEAWVAMFEYDEPGNPQRVWAEFKERVRAFVEEETEATFTEAVHVGRESAS